VFKVWYFQILKADSLSVISRENFKSNLVSYSAGNTRRSRELHSLGGFINEKPCMGRCMDDTANLVQSSGHLKNT